MAWNRHKIKRMVEMNLGGRSNDELENILCDEALDVALDVHNFGDAISIPSDITITEDANSVSIATVTNLKNIVTARIVEASGSRNEKLIMKNRTWWDTFVINAEDNQKGWPEFGMRAGTTVYLDRPANSNLELRLRVTTLQTFSNDNTECPVAILDKFVVKYVTAEMFAKLKQTEAARDWRSKALGPYFDTRGEPGGFLAMAINHDKADIAEELQMRDQEHITGVSVRNDNDWHDDYGNIRVWH